MFPKVFNGNSKEPICPAYSSFARAWSIKRLFYENCKSITEIKEVGQMYLTTFLEYVTFQGDKAEADYKQYKFKNDLQRSR